MEVRIQETVHTLDYKFATRYDQVAGLLRCCTMTINQNKTQ
jgi:hypothetical protein